MQPFKAEVVSQPLRNLLPWMCEPALVAEVMS